MEHETFYSLLTNPAHWGFELFFTICFDGLVLGIAWPFLRKHWNHHVERDKKDEKE